MSVMMQFWMSLSSSWPRLYQRTTPFWQTTQFQPYVFLLHIATTDERPDIVIWNNSIKEVWVIELTVCFETGFDKAHDRKTCRYLDLMEQVDSSPWNVSLVTLEVGSRGFLSLQSFNTIKQQLIECNKKQWESFLVEVTSRPPPVPALCFPTPHCHN